MTTWDPSSKDTAVALSNGNLTATLGSGSNKGAMGTTSKGAGRWVYSAVINKQLTSGSQAIGLGWGIPGIANTGNYVGDTGSLGFYANGDGTLGNPNGPDWADTNRIYVALVVAGNGDLTAYCKIAGRSWNENGSANPDTNTGGYSVSPGTLFSFAPMVSFGSATEAVTIEPAAPGHGLTTFTTWDAASQTLAPSLLTNSQTFHAPTVSPGAVALSPGLFTNASTFYGPTISQPGGGAQTLTPVLLVNSPVLYAASVIPGALSLSPGLLSNGGAIFGPAVAAGPVSLAPALLTNTSLLHAPAATPGTVTLQPAQLANANTIYVATVAPGAASLTAGLLTNVSALYPPGVTLLSGDRTVLPPRLETTSQIFPPVVPGGARTLQPGLLVNPSVIFRPAASQEATPGTYPLSIGGRPRAVRSPLTGAGAVAAGAFRSAARTIVTHLRGRP